MTVRRRLTPRQATWIGLLAIVLWSAIVGLIRSVSESFGALGGAALIYSLASLILMLTVGRPRLRDFPPAYLGWGSLLFVSYELCLSLSIGYAHSGRQAIEVSMLNYLWPTFTMVAAILFNGQRANLLIVPGFVLSMAGVCRILGGEDDLTVTGILTNVQGNPLSYGLAFLGALLWATYCTVTARIAKGVNGVTLFFSFVALVLWIQYLLTDGPPLHFTPRALVDLGLAAAALGLGYAAWNVGLLHGRVTVLAGASYFTPVLSAALAALMLGAPLTGIFWQGALMVCLGSILCWLATRGRSAARTRLSRRAPEPPANAG